MISWDDFQKAIREVCLLTGQNPPKEQMQAIYRKIQHYELQDFLKACEDDQLLEEWTSRVNYPSIRRAIERHQSKRLEIEHEEAKKRELEELHRLIHQETTPEEIRQFIRSFGR